MLGTHKNTLEQSLEHIACHCPRFDKERHEVVVKVQRATTFDAGEHYRDHAFERRELG